MPSSAVRSNMSPSRAAPSSMEYSVWTWRWTNPSRPAVMEVDQPFPELWVDTARWPRLTPGRAGEDRQRTSASHCPLTGTRARFGGVRGLGVESPGDAGFQGDKPNPPLHPQGNVCEEAVRV